MADQQQPVSGGNGKNKKRAFLIVGIVVIVGLVAAYFYTGYRTSHISTDDAFVEGDVFTIASRVDGTVKKVHVDSNQAVKKGDLLVELDPADYRSKANAARANLELQRANLRYAERERQRAEALFNKEVSTAERRDKAISAHEMALAQVTLAEEQLRQAELNLGYTTITAPADGYVTKKNVQPGNQVQDGQPLMALVSLDDLYIVANYKETQMTSIRPGQAVRIKVDAYPGRTFTGKVDSIMAGTGVSFSLFPPENATGNYVKVVQRIPVKIVLDKGEDRDHVLRIGMSVVPTVLAK
jgi:membrane fusion protein (multidrug efflux system)